MFKSFFKKIDKPEAPKETEKLCCGFVPFQVKQDMALAPVYGFDKLKSDEAKQEFDTLFQSQVIYPSLPPSLPPSIPPSLPPSLLPSLPPSLPPSF